MTRWTDNVFLEGNRDGEGPSSFLPKCDAYFAENECHFTAIDHEFMQGLEKTHKAVQVLADKFFFFYCGANENHLELK